MSSCSLLGCTLKQLSFNRRPWTVAQNEYGFTDIDYEAPSQTVGMFADVTFF